MSEHTPEEQFPHPPERRKGYTEIKQTIDHRMAYLEDCFSRWLRRGLIAFSIIGTACFFALFGFGLILHNQSKTDGEIKALALGANLQSQTAIEATLNKEKICADSSDVGPCRALFERLSRSVTEEQRYRLGCAAIKNLEGPTAESLRKENPRCRR